MKRRTPIAILALAALSILAGLAACGRAEDRPAPPPAPVASSSGPAISGRIEEGLRVLTFDPGRPAERFTIYRGDYVRPEVAGGEAATIELPDLGVTLSVPTPEGEGSYFKVPDAGVFRVVIGDWTAEIEAIEYSDAHYREVDAQQAARLIEDLEPFILDVRTPSEFAGGHIEGAVLIPVQVLAQRIGELADVKDQPLFVYCRSGNRSTVAGKMLVDAGFGEVINLRHGIAEWTRAGLPTVK